MPVYAVAESVPERYDILTAGKRYKVLAGSSDGDFCIIDDIGGKIFCLWQGCSFLNGGDWTCIEEPDVDEHGNFPDDPAFNSGMSAAEFSDYLDTIERAPGKRMVFGPTHYTSLPIEPWDIMAANFTKAEFEGFLKGNVLKYLLRYPSKGGLEDVRKAKHYLERLEKLLGEKE